MRRDGLPPLVGSRPRILVVGTFPSEVSLTSGRYYDSPGNRFWNVMEAALGVTFPEDYEVRREILARAQIALWDVVKSCERPQGVSADKKIEDPAPNDLGHHLRQHPSIQTIVFNGKGTHRLWRKMGGTLPPGVLEIPLLSTSRANRVWGEEAENSWRTALKR